MKNCHFSHRDCGKTRLICLNRNRLFDRDSHEQPQVFGWHRGNPRAEFEPPSDRPELQAGPGQLDLLQFPQALLPEIVDDELIVDFRRTRSELEVELPP